MSPQPRKAARGTPDRRHRRHPRYRCSFPVEVKLFHGGQYRKQEAHCKDLSEAGIGLILAAELSPSEVVSMKFSLPDSGETCEASAVLRHRLGFQYGFEFLSLPGALRAAIDKYLEGQERAD